MRRNRLNKVKGIRVRCFGGMCLVGAALFVVPCVLGPETLLAQNTQVSPYVQAARPAFPSQYGEVIYRYNEGSPNQIYIIGMSHRDSFTRGNGAQTSKVQAEVFKLGDWLIHNKGLELLLPEGFFKKKPSGANAAEKEIALNLERKTGCEETDRQLADFAVLQERLSNDSKFVNAEMLLKASHLILVDQVEDWSLYDAARKGLLKLVASQKEGCSYPTDELDYLQDKRLVGMLQNIPGVVDGEFQQGHIKEKKAIFTIGMMHVPEIVKYLAERKIAIRSPLPANENYSSEVNLLTENYGVTVILPRTLLNDRDVLRANHLDKLVEQSRKTGL